MKTSKKIKASFTEFKEGTNWCYGKAGKYVFEAKLYDNGSVFGINEGRVSKFYMWDENNSVVEYERGWSMKPSKEVKPYFNAIMELLENAPKRFSE